MKVIVKKNNLRYRIPGLKDGLAFIPKIGDMIPLPKELVKIEMSSGNVRSLLPEEKEALRKRIEAKKKLKKKAER